MHPNSSRQEDPSWIDWPNECVERAGTTVHLTPKAFAVLHTLAAHAGQLVPKAALLEAVWPETAVSEAVLTECIRELRQAFGETARAPRWLQTVHRRGYRFVGPAPGSGSSLGGEPPALGPSPAVPLPPRRPVPPATHLATPPFVGRGAEMAALHARLAQARAGARQMVFITGEPGMGKTALVQAFVAAVRAAGGVGIAQGQCLDHHGVGEAYLPVLEALDRLCRTPEGATCLAVLEQHAPLWLAQLPALLSPAALEAVQRRLLGATPARMLREMADALAMLTQDDPLVLVLEDMHWSDAATLDLLGALAQRPDPARLLVLCTYRPVDVIVRQHPLKALKQALEMHHQCTDLPLELLSVAEVAQYLAARVVAPLSVPVAALARTLHQRTDGHPLFLVTMVDDLERQGVLQETGEAENATALRGMPATLRRLITQWYDELPAQDQQVLDAASVAGMTWSAAAVAAGLEVDVEVVEARGAALVRCSQWLAAQGLESWPDGTVAECYRWQHPLYQEAVYERLPAGLRLRLHQRLGARLAAGYGAQASAHAAALADHFVRGRDAARAVPYLQQAAQNALQRHGYQEAIGHLTQGLALLASLPETPTRAQQELDLQMSLGPALMATKGTANPEVEQTYARARALCQHMGDPPQLFQTLWSLCRFYRGQGALLTARELGEQLERLAARAGDPLLRLQAQDALGTTLFYLGDYAAARTHVEQGITLIDPTTQRVQALYQGEASGLRCLGVMAQALWCLGYPAQAVQWSQEALVLAQGLAHPYSVAAAQHWATSVSYRRREMRAVQTHAEALLALATVQQFPVWVGHGTCWCGWVRALQGAGAAGRAHLRAGRATVLATGQALFQPLHLLLLAETAAHAGEAEDGLHVLAEALTLMEANGQGDLLAEAYRLHGALLLRQSVPDAIQAEAYFQQALALARRQQAKSWELRAAMSLSRLWQQQGKQAEARVLLAPIYGWFTEGFDTTDLQEAKTLLDELGG